MRATAADPTGEATLSRPGPARFAGAVIAIAVTSWLPVLVGATTRTALGWLAAAALALVLEKVTRQLHPVALVSGLLVSSALVPSGLVTDATHYMPVAVTGGALGLRVGLAAWRTRRVSGLSAQPVLVAVGLYLAWAAVATLTSTDPRVSALYLAGMVGVCALAFGAIPKVFLGRPAAQPLLAALGVLGVLVGVSVYLVLVVGNINVFGRPVGDVQYVDLTLGGQPTGLFFNRSSGAYLAPLEASMVMVVGVVALLGWSATLTGRPLLAARLAVAFLVPAILLTLDRTAWLAAIVSTGAFAVLARAATLKSATAAILCASLALSFVLVLINAAGVNAVRPSTCTANCAPGNDETPIRGGTGLSDREYLWRASLYAIEKRPVFGFGPGTDVSAIDPYLAVAGARIHGLTSHSTWLRTGVEMGIPGLAFLLAVLGAVAWRVWRGLRGATGDRDSVHLALVASVCGLVPAMTFESFLLGGVAFSSLYLTLAIGLIAGRLTSDPVAARPARPSPA